tara:strand:- start:171 stop:401 length:231 start_codon:yes stop_codon:yes gene_type:complete
MSVDLVRKEDGERLILSNQIWGFILQTAEENGWEPEGTSLLDEETEKEKKIGIHLIILQMKVKVLRKKMLKTLLML